MSASLSVEHLTAIGKVAVKAARLERLIGHFLADAISADDEVSHLVVTPMRFEQRVQLLQRVLATRMAGRPALDETLRAIQSLSTAMHTRNRFLHALWEFSEENQLQIGKRENNTAVLVMSDVSLSDATSAANEIATIARRIEPAYFDLLVDLGVFAQLDEGVSCASKLIGRTKYFTAPPPCRDLEFDGKHPQRSPRRGTPRAIRVWPNLHSSATM